MIEPAFHFCPRCGGNLIITQHEGESMQMCESCHHILYKNQNATVSGIVIHDHQMLCVRRGREPQKGMLDFVGGFVRADEKPALAIVRETEEELGVKSSVIQLFGAYGPSTYPYEGITHYNLDLIYQIRLGSFDLKPQDDVAGFEWIDLAALPYGQMAFPSQNEFLEEVKKGKIHLEEK
ncbi:hypothetical protein C5B42_00975 [Candidatus Cerribacteria bacterium 'Amazon FNV 2010 28 9']|uniref:Nudix hydrolase domain-containing protein n=1 Tax=Candidatus Cerribacteria bacterium 'Amazon FNV 2010 28 9' TaxID=2081795 RepID=A0A317JPQ3_9BACT|nr:MAG: hypothetical protein C5B42_00975 [Candidatus Cerribacteria bacterium 'Amazon FNV 2010 28 9']